MPSSMTHSYFGKDVYDKVNDKTKKKLKDYVEDIKTFSNGPDIFYFYNLMLTKKDKRIKKIGYTMHRKEINNYFINLVNYINDNNLNNNKQILAYLFGSICHFVLDSTTHPFIFYKTGNFDKNDPKTYKYNGLHQEMEYYIDIYMIFNNEKIEAKYFKVYKNIFNYHELDPKLLKLITEVNKDTYNIDNSGYYYEKSIKDMKRFYHIFNYDRYGIKKIAFKLIDKLSSKKRVRKEVLSFNIYHNKKVHYLNLEKKEWNHPANLEEVYDYSFIELYRIAITKATNIINEVMNMLDKKKIDERKIRDLFKNISYATGKNCEEKHPLQYFEF